MARITRRPKIDPHDRRAAIASMELLAQTLELRKRGDAWGPCPWCGSYSLTFFARRRPNRDEVYGMFRCGAKTTYPDGRGVLYCDVMGNERVLIEGSRQRPSAKCSPRPANTHAHGRSS